MTRKSGLKVAGEFGEDTGSKTEPVHLRLFRPLKTGWLGSEFSLQCPPHPSPSPAPAPRSLGLTTHEDHENKQCPMHKTTIKPSLQQQPKYPNRKVTYAAVHFLVTQRSLLLRVKNGGVVELSSSMLLALKKNSIEQSSNESYSNERCRALLY